MKNYSTFILISIFISSVLFNAGMTTELGVWAGEGASYGKIKSWVDTLAEEDVSLYLNISPESLGDPSLISLIRSCNEKGVEVRGWLVLDYSLGYWPNERNAEEVLVFSEDFLDWVDENDLHVGWISIDMETPIYQMERINEFISNGQYLKAIALLIRNINRDKYDHAVSVYNDLVEMAHGRGVSVHCVTSGGVLDDFQDGDDDLQDAMETPVLPIPWDEVSIMLYRSGYTELLGFDMGPYFVYHYSLDAHYMWQDAACIDIGVVGGTGYDDPSYAEEDAMGIKAAGIDKIHFYCLENIMAPQSEGVEWFHAARDAEPEAPMFSPLVWLFRSAMQFVDLLI